jgi:hypothetical protein
LVQRDQGQEQKLMTTFDVIINCFTNFVASKSFTLNKTNALRKLQHLHPFGPSLGPILQLVRKISGQEIKLLLAF